VNIGCEHLCLQLLALKSKCMCGVGLSTLSMVAVVPLKLILSEILNSRLPLLKIRKCYGNKVCMLELDS